MLLYSPFITLCLGSIRMDRVIGEGTIIQRHYRKMTIPTTLQRNYRKMTIHTILQRNYRKMTIPWSFSYNSFIKFHNKKCGSQNMAVLYPHSCYNEVCYKGTALVCCN